MHSHLYLLSRVKKVERTKKFKEWKAQSETRRASARKAAQTRRDKTLAKVRSRLDEIQLDPQARGLSQKRLRKLAVASYLNVCQKTARFLASPMNDPTNIFH